jgi:hypothetical protein
LSETSRRFVSNYPRLVGRVWNDVTRELEDFLRRVMDTTMSGIPGGWFGTVPPPTAAVGTAGSINAGWRAADAVVPQGIVTVKGDLLGYSTAPVRHGVGSDASVLISDSAEATGLRWADQSELTGVPGSGGGGGGGSEGGWVRHFMMLGD